jgi:hypothetical protein
MDNPKDAIVAMHAYEGLSEYIDSGLDTDGQAQVLLDLLYDQWCNAWDELPAICGDRT